MNCEGNRPISRKAAEKYARVFGRSPSWYLYGDEGIAGDAVYGDAASPKTKINEARDIRALLKRIDGLTSSNIAVLLSAIQGFQRANAEQTRSDHQSAPASRRRQAEPS